MSKVVTWVIFDAAAVHALMDPVHNLQQCRVLLYDAMKTLASTPRRGAGTTAEDEKDTPTSIRNIELSTAVPYLQKKVRVVTELYTEEQKEIVLDFLAQVIRFCRCSPQLALPDKVSTILGLALVTHLDSMRCFATMTEAYKIFGEHLTLHSVHRPPFSTGIFTPQDAQMINEWMLFKYFRFYKLYFFTFTARPVANLRCVPLGELNEVPPPCSSLPPQSRAIPLSVWQTQQAALIAAQEDAQRLAEAATEAKQREETEKLQRLSLPPPRSEGLKKQLECIKGAVSKLSHEKLDELETRLAVVENRVAEVTKPPSAAGKAPPKAKGK